MDPNKKNFILGVVIGAAIAIIFGLYGPGLLSLIIGSLFAGAMASGGGTKKSVLAGATVGFFYWIVVSIIGYPVAVAAKGTITGFETLLILAYALSLIVNILTGAVAGWLIQYFIRAKNG